MMEKEYQQWHSQKVSINALRDRPYFHERQIWFCRLGVNVGFEQDGRGEAFLRPVVILKKFSNKTFWGVPLTTAHKEARPYFFSFSFRPGVVSTALLSQLRLFDAKRLRYRAGVIALLDFLSLKEKLKQLLA